MPRQTVLGLSFSLCMILAATPVAFARTQTGFLDRTVTVSGTSYEYKVYVRADFSKKKPWPVILFLHGAGERGADGLRQTDVGIAHAIRLHSARFTFLIQMQQCGAGQ